MHHDIYDTPVVNNNLQNEFLQRLNKYDYLFFLKFQKYLKSYTLIIK